MLPAIKRPVPGHCRREAKEDNALSQNNTEVADTAAPAIPMTRVSKKKTDGKLLNFILTELDKEKAEDVVTISLKGKSEIADAMVVCSGRSTRQVSSIAEKLSDRLKQEMGVQSKLEGKAQGDWVLIDAGDVIIHIFRPEVREFYQLEKLWMDPARTTPKS